MNNGNVVVRVNKGEDFESVVRLNTMVNTELTGNTCEKANVTKLRDSGRVAFLENKKYYFNTLAQMETCPESEMETMEKVLTKYFERAQMYLSRYDQAKCILDGWSAELKEQKQIAKEQASLEATAAMQETLTSDKTELVQRMVDTLQNGLAS